jgi:hypothetical protein
MKFMRNPTDIKIEPHPSTEDCLSLRYKDYWKTIEDTWANSLLEFKKTFVPNQFVLESDTRDIIVRVDGVPLIDEDEKHVNFARS